MTPANLDADLYTYRATCKRVVDGDTFDLVIDLGLGVHNVQRVRLFGVDTPETYGVKKDSEEYKAGMKAKMEVMRLLQMSVLPQPSFWVETHKDKTGKYGRYLATIWIKLEDEVVSLADHLIKEGLAEAMIY